MGLKETLKRLEQKAMPGKELCPHLPALIEHADGSIENESTHDCGRARLRIVVGFTDGSDARTQHAAHDTLAKIRECCELPVDEAAELVAARFPITTAELLERAA